MTNMDTELKIKFRYGQTGKESKKIIEQIEAHFDAMYFNSDVEIVIKSVYREPTTRCEE